MHIDWNWIKQRPQFLAEHLAEYYQVIVFAPYYKKRNMLVLNRNERIKVIYYFPLPFRFRNKLIGALDRTLTTLWKRLIAWWYKPDYLWVTSPELCPYISSKSIVKSSIKLIYDCMDDILEFERGDSFKERMLAYEKLLVSMASIVFVSSRYLQDTLQRRIACGNKTKLVRNAFGGRIITPLEDETKPAKTSNRIILGYFGTISTWLDFEALQFCLKKISNLEIHLWGPIENESVVTQETKCLLLHRPVQHDALYDLAQKCDALIMPFKLNNLIQSVDPVKLYEYINYNRPILSIYYNEISRFEPFVNFYSDKEGLLNALQELIRNGFAKKYNSDLRTEFLKSNTWSERVRLVNESLQLL